MVTYSDLFQICVEYTATNYFVGDVIPENKLANARKRYPIPDRERVVALLDTTVFGSAKAGLAVGETGLHWRNSNVETNRTYMSWREVASAPIIVKGIMTPQIELGKGIVIELIGGGLGKHDVAKLLTELQHLVRSPTANRPPPITAARKQWMLAINNKQYGPYDLPTIQGMVAAQQIDPEQTWVWQEGWHNWAQFSRVSALAALLQDSSRLPTIPPPLPTSTPSTSETYQRQEREAQRSARHEIRQQIVSYDDLFQVCSKYSGDNYYVGEAIPQKKLANARSSYFIPDTEEVVALLDTTVFGSAKTGLATCVGGVYWRDILSEPKTLSWTELASVEIRSTGSDAVEIGSGNTFQSLSAALQPDETVKLLKEIQALNRSSASVSPTSTGARAGGETIEGPSHRRTQRKVKQDSSRVDLNHASVDHLLALPGITLVNGQKLIKERERRRGFDTVEEVGYLLELRPHEVERLRERTLVESYQGSRPAPGRVIDF